MHVTDLTDAGATSEYLHEIARTVPIEDAEARAEDALDFTSPPAGAWTVLAHVAEHRGDYAGLERWTAAALDVDPHFGPALADDAYLALLRQSPAATAPPAVRADDLFSKLEHLTGRGPQLRAQLDLAGAAIGVELPEPTPAAIDVAECWLFTGCQLFEAGLLDQAIAVLAGVLPAGELALLTSWRGVRHRLVRQVSATRRRWTLADVETGEVIETHTLIDETWQPDREGFVLVVPVGDVHVVVGEPIVLDERHQAEARAVLAARDAGEEHAVARAVLRWRAERQRDMRIRFVFPDLDPAAVDTDEAALLDLIRSRSPGRAARADAGDVMAEADLLLEAIVAERIITRRVLHTWDMAEALVALGGTRESVLAAVREATYAELWARFGPREEAA